MAYAVTTPVFEGPFDLLLHLISNQQVDIHEVRLTSIVEAFVSELEAMSDALDLEQSSEFLLIAAILIELKAKRLLPRPEGVEIDDELLWEERDLLLARLLECKTFKDAAAALSGLSATAALSWPRRNGPDDRYADLVPDLLAGVTVDKLQAAFLRATTPKPVPTVDLSHVTPMRISVADAVAELIHELPRVRRITFRRLTADLTERIDVVVHFLAVLELYKQGVIDLEQAETFGELTVTWTGGSAAEAAELVLAGSDLYDG